MGRRKGSQNKTKRRIMLSGKLSLEDRLKLVAGLIVDRILADLGSADKEAQSNG